MCLSIEFKTNRDKVVDNNNWVVLISSKICYIEVTMQISRGPFAFWPKQKHELNKEIHEKFYNCFPF